MIRRVQTGQGLNDALATGRLRVAHVVFFVMSATAPLTVVAGVLVTAYAVTGNTGLPIAFAAVAAVLAVFAVGYVATGRYLPHAGAIYAYVSHGIGRAPGVGAAWVALVAYNAIECSLYGAIGAAVSPLVENWVGVELPWPVYAIAAWALVAALGMARVDLNGGVLAVLLVCEVALIIVFDAAFLTRPVEGPAWSVWSVDRLSDPGFGALLAIAVLGYVGIEATVVFSEETREPRRTIPVAMYAAIAVTTAVYAVSAWAITAATGTSAIVTAATESGTDLVFDLIRGRLGPLAATAGHVLFATSIIAAMISFHNMTARYVYALGREGVLPRVFGRTSRSGAPVAGSAAQSLVGLAVITGFAAGGADPVVRLFYTFSTSGSLGVLILLVGAAMSVLGFFARDSRGEGIWRTRVAPSISLTALMVILVLVLANFGTLLGVAEDDPLRWGVPVAYLLTVVAGCVYAAVLRVRQPEVFRAIGLGGKSALERRRSPLTSEPRTSEPGTGGLR
ncbi:MAG: hypothetical protein QG622_2927 [Actinomycetota bacterium]|nr:hypothetical protein [Actinomycetota bacterium]